MSVQMELSRIIISEINDQQVVYLKEVEGDRTFPILIGLFEATSIDRRVDYAQWLTSPENPHFARSLVNRVWSYFFHRGIIDPVDDLRSTSPPINAPLLDALTKDFVAHKFDLRHLMRVIVTSRTYQRSAVANDTNAHDDANFSHAIPRRLPAEVLLDAVSDVTAVPESFAGYPVGLRAVQLPDPTVNSYFLTLFGRSDRVTACACERSTTSLTSGSESSPLTIERMRLNCAGRSAPCLAKDRSSVLRKSIRLWTFSTLGSSWTR